MLAAAVASQQVLLAPLGLGAIAAAGGGTAVVGQMMNRGCPAALSGKVFFLKCLKIFLPETGSKESRPYKMLQTERLCQRSKMPTDVLRIVHFNNGILQDALVNILYIYLSVNIYFVHLV